MPQDTGVGRNVVLDGLDFASLRRVWEQTFGAAPPRSLSRVFMCRVLLHKRQCRTHGGLSAATRRRLGVRPKKRGPDQWVPVIRFVMAVRDG